MYCLDTNIVIYYQNNIKTIVNKILSVDEKQICISHITRAELFYGAYKSQKREENLSLQNDFCNAVDIINPSFESDKVFGQIKSNFKKLGATIADFDLLIASICIANDLVLVTNNIKHFQNIENLKLENWFETE